MCRNIKTLHNFKPPATDEEIRASALQYVRKLAGMNKPSKANAEVFDRAVSEVTQATQRLLGQLATSAAPRDRDEQQQRDRERGRRREAERRARYASP